MKKTVLVVLAVFLLMGGACDDASLPTEVDEFKASLRHEADMKPPKPHPHQACDTCGVVYRRSRLTKIEIFHFSYWDYLGAKKIGWRVGNTRIYVSANRVKKDFGPELKSLCSDCYNSLWQSLEPEEPHEKDTVQHIEGSIHFPGDPDCIVPERIRW